MISFLKSVGLWVSAIRLIPHILTALVVPTFGMIRADLERWAEIQSVKKPIGTTGFIGALIFFMTTAPEYRNVFYLRIGRASRLLAWLCPPLSSLSISSSTQIGPGLYIQHGFATTVAADRIGANCWINQQVAIGFSNKTDCPTIGDNVKIHAGAKIVGRIKVGDNSTIGLNTVVITNVPCNATIFGVPGKIVWLSDRAEACDVSTGSNALMVGTSTPQNICRQYNQ